MTDITTPESARETLHVDPAETLRRETEIGALAAKLRANDPSMRWIAEHQPVMVGYESGARAGLSAYRECYELCVLIAAIPPDGDPVVISRLVTFARAALEAANG